MIHVILVDDHAIVRSGLKQIFSLLPDIEVVAEASNGSELLALLNEHKKISLVLLDLNMEGISGDDLISRVKAHRPTLPILVLSMHNEPQIVARTLRCGANGYITKDCNPEILLDAMRKVARGGRYIDPVISEKMAFDKCGTNEAHLHTMLSDRERDVLRMLTQGKAVKEIADQLAISGKTVSTYKVRLMDKLQVANMAELMRYSMEHGLLD